jgi:hypothetical protein
MKKNIKTLITAFSLIVAFSNTLFGIEWPQEDYNNDAFNSYFGQNVAGKISTSLVFRDPAEVKAMNDGKILIVMTDVADDSEFFPSTLGNTVILCHEDDLISVYANLDGETLEEKTEAKKTFAEGEIIAETGNSGWQEKRSNLEFQIIDLQKSTAINPKILLPRAENEIEYTLTGIMLQNKDGKFFDIRENKIYPSGLYKVFQTRNEIAAPYKTTVTINGVVVDEIAFDTIGQENGKLYLIGKKKYNSEDLYPDKNLLLLGEMMLTPGRSTLGLTAQNFLGKIKQQSYVISIY